MLKKIDGWKTAIAAAYWPIVTQIIPIWFPEGVPDTAQRVIVTLGIFLSMIGVGHKWYKKSQETK